MIIATDRYVVRAKSSNEIYWEQDVYPAWTPLRCFRYFPNQRPGHGVEPHYHDCDEIWLFTQGRGEVWLDGQSHPISPNTFIYTPMGVVHRFQMFTESAVCAIVTPLERQKRATHITVEESDPPEPTVPGFVVPGKANVGPVANRGPRCPLSELRAVSLAPGQTIGPAETSANEHWIVMDGAVFLTLDGVRIELGSQDVALVRSGSVLEIEAPREASMALARE